MHSTVIDKKRKEYEEVVVKRSLIIVKILVMKLVNVLYSSF